MRSLSRPLACMAFLLLSLLGVHAGNAEGSSTACLSATAFECQWPISEHTKAICCPADRPICTSVMGRLGCYAPSDIIPRDDSDIIPRDDGYPYSTITLDWGDGTKTSTTSLKTSCNATKSMTFSSSVPTVVSSSLSAESSHTDHVTVTVVITAGATAFGKVIATAPADAAISARHTDSTTSSDYIIVSGHHTGSVASRTTTYSPDATLQTTGPFFSAYTDTAWYTGGSWNTWSWNTLNHPTTTAAVAGRDLTSISLAENDFTTVTENGFTTVTATNAETTYILALITNSAASIPSSCQRLLTGTGSAGTPLYYTYVARECTGAHTTTISSTTTTTSTSIFDSVKKAGVAAETSMSFNVAPSSELDKTTVSTTITNTCASAGTITVTVQETPITSTVTAFYNTTVIGSITTSSLVITSSDPSSGSSEPSDPSSTADAVTTGDLMSSIISSSSMPSILTPPTTPTTPLASGIPGTPTPTVFDGGAGVVQVGHGMLTILTFAFFILQ